MSNQKTPLILTIEGHDKDANTKITSALAGLLSDLNISSYVLDPKEPTSKETTVIKTMLDFIGEPLTKFCLEMSLYNENLCNIQSKDMPYDVIIINGFDLESIIKASVPSVSIKNDSAYLNRPGGGLIKSLLLFSEEIISNSVYGFITQTVIVEPTNKSVDKSIDKIAKLHLYDLFSDTATDHDDPVYKEVNDTITSYLFATRSDGENSISVVETSDDIGDAVDQIVQKMDELL